MRGFSIRLLLVLMLLALPAGTVRAGEVGSPDPRDVVPGTGGSIYLDLARQVMPGLEASEGAYRGSEVIDLRHIAGPGMEVSPPQEFRIFNSAALPVRSDGRDRLLMFFDLGEGAESAEGFVVLALYELGKSPVLLDAAQIGFDRSTFFRDPAGIALDDSNDLVLTMSTHSNSHQTYVTSAMILMREGQLQLVDTVFTFGDRACGFERSQMPEFSAARNARAYADIVVEVTETTRHTGETCGDRDLPEAGSRRIEVAYRWDDMQSRFVPDSEALQLLAQENRDRF